MKNQHFRLNRILLLLIGLWPYQRTKFEQFQWILLLSIQMTFVVCQFATFLTSRCTMDLILRTLFFVFFLSINIILYVSFYVNNEAVKILFDRILHTYDELKDVNEVAIIKKYGSKTQRYTIAFTTFAICSFFCIILIQMWPCILNVVLPLNKSRSLLRLQMIEYMHDGERYIYLVLMHANLTILVAILAMLGTGTMFFAYGQHICGMFRIANYRIYHAMGMDMSQPISTKNENLIHKEIIFAVNMHRKGMQFSDYLMSKFALCFALLIACGVLSVSLNLLQMFQTISSGYNIEKLTMFLLFLFVQYLFMFMANYVAQEVADHNNHLFATVYNVHWYLAPLHIQKMILFLLQKGTKPFSLNLGGIFVGSLEGFATLMSATISYFTVIYSMRR